MSAYECIRQSNIKRNEAVLQALGIPTQTAETTHAPKQRSSKRRMMKEIKNGERFSKRLRGERADGVSESPNREVSEVKLSHAQLLSNKKSVSSSRWAKDLLDDSSSVVESANIWNQAKMHQHLELSKSRRLVVTTGCAGYGAVLLKSTGKSAGVQTWAVEVVELGVGGFAVGVANANAKGPYKSLGNRPDSWVLHSSGYMLHNRTQRVVEGFESGYSVGDIIHVTVSEKRVLSFAVNDRVVDFTIGLPAGKNTYVLCCQPYMGGAARLL